MDGQSQEVKKEKRSKLFLVAVLLFLIIIIIGLVLGIVFLKKNEETSDEEFTELTSKVAQFTIGPGLGEEPGSTYEELSSEIEDAINSAKSQKDKVLNCVLLSRLQLSEEMFDEAELTINNCKQIKDLEGKFKYNLLAQMVVIKETEGDLEGRIEAIEELLELPDDMELENIDWKSTKEHFQKVLEKLTNQRGEVIENEEE